MHLSDIKYARKLEINIISNIEFNSTDVSIQFAASLFYTKAVTYF